MNERDSIRSIKGIGEKTQALFGKLGIETIGDLLRYYPRDYDEYKTPIAVTEIKEGEKCAVLGRISGRVGMHSTGRKSVVTAGIREGAYFLQLTWYNMPFLRNTLQSGGLYVFRGTVIKKQGRLTMEQPEIFGREDYQKMLHTLYPIYGLTKGLTNKLMVKTMHQVLESRELTQEYLPEEYRTHYGLSEYNYAVAHIHFPKNREELAIGHNRLVFDEFFFFFFP